jgi:hypothetical protein
MISVNGENSDFHVMADSVDDALCKTADIYNSMGMTGDSLNISIMKMANIDISEPKPKKPYWRGNKQTEPESEPQAVER